MTSSKMYMKPREYTPLTVLIALVAAALAVAVLLSKLVDTAHVSVARGEALREALKRAPVRDSGDAGRPGPSNDAGDPPPQRPHRP